MACHRGNFFSKHTKVSHEVGVDPGELLLHAVKEGNEALTRKLISRGVPVGVRDQFGCDPTYYAARHNHLNILKMLIESDASIDSTTLMNRTALQIAAYHGNIGCVQYLLRMRANVNAVDDLGMSALHWAAENNRESTVELLLKSGADCTLINKFGKSAQKLALMKNNTEIHELFEDNCISDLFGKDDQDATSETFTRLLSQPNIIDPNILKNRLLKSKFKDIAMANKSDTIKLFEQHGIKLLPVDDSTLIVSALNGGKTAVLTEAGKLALKKTEPHFLYNLVQPNTSNPFVKMSSKMMCKEKPRRLQQKFKNVDSEIAASEPKIFKIDETMRSNSTTHRNIVINRSQKSENSNEKLQRLRRKNSVIAHEDCNKCKDSIEKYRELEKRLKFLEDQLFRKSQTLKKLKDQLEESMKLTKSYKGKYEMKEREASLYKVQLQNTLKTLAKKKLMEEKNI